MTYLRYVLIGLCLMASQATPALAFNDCKWTGLAANDPNGEWSRSANWTDCANGVPQDGDTVIFPNGARKGNNTNNLANRFIFKLQISGRDNNNNDYDIGGQTFTLTGQIVFSAVAGNRGGARITAPIIFVDIVTFEVTRGDAGDIRLGAVTMGNQLFMPVAGGAKLTVAALDGLANAPFVKTGAGELSILGGGYRGEGLILDGPFIALSAAAFGVPTGRTLVGGDAKVVLQFAGPLDEPFLLNDSVAVPLGNLQATVGELHLKGNLRLNSPNARLFVGPNTHVFIEGTVTSQNAPKSFVKNGPGQLTFARGGHQWAGFTALQGTVRLAAADALPDGAPFEISALSTLELDGHDEVIGALSGSGKLLLGGRTLTVVSPANTTTTFTGLIQQNGTFTKSGPGRLFIEGVSPNTHDRTIVTAGELRLQKTPGVAAVTGALIISGGVVESFTNQVLDTTAVTVNSPGVWGINEHERIASLSGNGIVVTRKAAPAGGQLLEVSSNTLDSVFDGAIGGQGGLAKTGTARMVLNGDSTFAGTFLIANGPVIVNGTLPTIGTLLITDGLLGGRGTIGSINGGVVDTPTTGTLSPGNSPGRMFAQNVLLAGPFVVELAGPDAGTGYDQLVVRGEANITGAQLRLSRSFTAREDAAFTIVSAARPITGTFAGLPEGAEVDVDGQRFRITYRGGTGNDIVLTAQDEPARTYFLSEGATGSFFDEDILLANPNDEAAPVELRFFKETGEQVTATRTLAAKSHMVVHVDEIPGMETAIASAQIISPSGLPIVVERTMFWDQDYHAGHTGGAVDRPSTDWQFAEGAQGFFDMFLLVVNPGTTPTDVTFTFLRESESPVTHTVTVGPGSRYTLVAGDLQELRSRAFGVTVHATQPIMAERALYFASTPGRQWGGGQESSGVTAASSEWLFAEGATSEFFDTFILLSNPQDAEARVTVQYLLPSGEVIEAPKTLAARARLTVNPKDEADTRLHASTMSMVVKADRPIVAERSMYWRGLTFPWGESHNSFGVTEPALRWGLAEGRVGGRMPFATYILLANPQTTAAQVRVSFLRDTGAPIVRTYTVGATSRFSIDAAEIEELRGTTFGALIESTNNVPIFLERSMYWDAQGIVWSGGTNGTGIRLP